MPEIGAFPDLRFRGALSNAYFPQQDLSCAIKLSVGHTFQLRAHPAKIQARFHCGAQQIVTCKLTYVLSTQMTKHQEVQRHAPTHEYLSVALVYPKSTMTEDLPTKGVSPAPGHHGT